MRVALSYLNRSYTVSKPNLNRRETEESPKVYRI